MSRNKELTPLQRNLHTAINPPLLSVGTLDYQAEFMFSPESSVWGLLDKAEEAGWNG